jgi:Asp-tRNA(Asn)/Glu-tRNA(Gln) amidotransferase C subunit
MSKIQIDEVIKTAFLARLNKSGINSSNKEKINLFQNDLNSILDQLNQIQEVSDSNSITFLDGWRTITIEELRKDEVDNSETYNKVKSNIINQFPNSIDNYCVIDGIFSES